MLGASTEREGMVFTGSGSNSRIRSSISSVEELGGVVFFLEEVGFEGFLFDDEDLAGAGLAGLFWGFRAGFLPRELEPELAGELNFERTLIPIVRAKKIKAPYTKKDPKEVAKSSIVIRG